MTRISPALCALFAATLVAAACSRTSMPSENDDGSTPGNNAGATPIVSGSQESDWAAIEKIEGEAKAIVKAAGCSASSECRTAPVGSRACGGPRYYLTYCSKTTDSAALFRKLDEVARAEQAYNRKYELVSTCEMRMPPAVALSGGSCVAQ